MTEYEKIKSMSMEEFAEWLDSFPTHDNAPWTDWWCKTYCDRCDTEIVRISDLYKDHCGCEEVECAWCEIHNKCRFFQYKDDTPDTLEMIKMWLESEVL